MGIIQLLNILPFIFFVCYAIYWRVKIGATLSKSHTDIDLIIIYLKSKNENHGFLRKCEIYKERCHCDINTSPKFLIEWYSIVKEFKKIKIDSVGLMENKCIEIQNRYLSPAQQIIKFLPFLASFIIIQLILFRIVSLNI